MDSVNVLIIVSVVCIAAMAMITLVTTRSNATIDHLARSAERTQERNDRARDRFYERVLEKLQVHGDPDAVVKVANMHGAETVRATDGSFRHDHAMESIDHVAERRRQRREARQEQAQQSAEHISAMNGMG